MVKLLSELLEQSQRDQFLKSTIVGISKTTFPILGKWGSTPPNSIRCICHPTGAFGQQNMDCNICAGTGLHPMPSSEFFEEFECKKCRSETLRYGCIHCYQAEKMGYEVGAGTFSKRYLNQNVVVNK